jgi:hypothetical protein
VPSASLTPATSPTGRAALRQCGFVLQRSDDEALSAPSPMLFRPSPLVALPNVRAGPLRSLLAPRPTFSSAAAVPCVPCVPRAQIFQNDRAQTNSR